MFMFDYVYVSEEGWQLIGPSHINANAPAERNLQEIKSFTDDGNQSESEHDASTIQTQNYIHLHQQFFFIHCMLKYMVKFE